MGISRVSPMRTTKHRNSAVYFNQAPASGHSLYKLMFRDAMLLEISSRRAPTSWTLRHRPGLNRSKQSTRARRGAWRRHLRRAGIIVGALLILFYGGIGWMFSSKIRSDAFEVEAPGDPEPEVEVLANSGDSIVLSLESDNHHLLEVGIRGVA